MFLTARLTITTHPMDRTVDIGDNVTFTCEASGGTGPISYRWLFNGGELMADPGHISSVDTTSLMITSVIATDGGTYSCDATDTSNGNLVLRQLMPADASNSNIMSNEATLLSKC